jgi:hypothetical protein
MRGEHLGDATRRSFGSSQHGAADDAAIALLQFGEEHAHGDKR